MIFGIPALLVGGLVLLIMFRAMAESGVGAFLTVFGVFGSLLGAVLVFVFEAESFFFYVPLVSLPIGVLLTIRKYDIEAKANQAVAMERYRAEQEEWNRRRT